MDNFVTMRTGALDGSRWSAHIVVPAPVASALEEWVDEREKHLREEIASMSKQITDLVTERDDALKKLAILQSAVVLVPKQKPSFWARLFKSG